MSTQDAETAVPAGYLDELFSLHVQLARPFETIGEVPDGLRVNCYVAGGAFQGARLNGTLRAVGGEWFTLRPDGVGVLDVRCTLETRDGALIFAEHGGLVDFGEDGYAELLRGELPTRRTAGVTIRYRTAHPAYRWLNRVQCVGWATVDLKRSTVDYAVFALRPQPDAAPGVKGA